LAFDIDYILGYTLTIENSELVFLFGSVVSFGCE